jgi:hypothetical protein
VEAKIVDSIEVETEVIRDWEEEREEEMKRMDKGYQNTVRM